MPELKRIAFEGTSAQVFTYRPESVKFIQFYSKRDPYRVLRTMYGSVKSLREKTVHDFTIVTIDVGADEKTYRLVTRFGDVYLTTAEKVLNELSGNSYVNYCARCGKRVQSLLPAEQKVINGVTQPYLCPTCEARRETTFRHIQENKFSILKESKFEDFIATVLKSMGVKFIRSYPVKTAIAVSIADFYIPEANLIIEANGLRFHTDARMSPSTIDGIVHGAFRDMGKFDAYIKAGYNVLVLHESDFGIKGMNYDSALSYELTEIVKQDIANIIAQNRTKIRKG